MKQHMIFATIALIVGAHSAAAKVDADKTQQAVAQFLSNVQRDCRQCFETEFLRVIATRSTADSATVYIEAIQRDVAIKVKLEFLKMDDGSWYMMGGVLPGRDFNANLDQAYDLDWVR